MMFDPGLTNLKSGGDVDGHVKNVHVPNFGIVAAAQEYKVFVRPRQHRGKIAPSNISSGLATMQSQIGKQSGGPTSSERSDVFTLVSYGDFCLMMLHHAP